MDFFSNNPQIATPEGFVDINNVELGQMVMGINGTPVEVIAIEKIEKAPAYRLTFEDGTAVITDEEQEWNVHQLDEYGHPVEEPMIMTSKELMDYDKGDEPYYPFYFMSPSYIQFNNEGNTSKKEKMYHDAGCNPLTNESKKLLERGVVAHWCQREAFLNGVMDTFGDVNDRGEGIFGTPNRELSDAFRYMALSLGFKITIDDDVKAGMRWHRIQPVSTDTRLFRTDKPMQRLVNYLSKMDGGKRLKCVQTFGEQPAVHIRVAAEDGQYVVNGFNLLRHKNLRIKN